MIDTKTEWVPEHLRGWDQATGADVAKEVFASAGCFYEKAMRDPDVWFRNLWSVERKRYQWSADPANAHAARSDSA